MKYYILFGPPEVGKGTHAGAIAQKYNLKHISTGEFLRAEIAAGTRLGKEARALMDVGQLMSDSTEPLIAYYIKRRASITNAVARWEE